MISFFTVNTQNKVTGIWEWEDKSKSIARIINGNWYGTFENNKLIVIENKIANENTTNNFIIYLTEIKLKQSNDYNDDIEKCQAIVDSDILGK